MKGQRKTEELSSEELREISYAILYLSILLWIKCLSAQLYVFSLKKYELLGAKRRVRLFNIKL